MTIIGTKWVFRNKLDKNGIVSRNKTRLVAQGYNQQEGIDYDETYAPVARLESIRILLAYAYALDFKLFQMDVKSAFLNGFINEEALKRTCKLSLESFASILSSLCEGECSYSEDSSLDSLRTNCWSFYKYCWDIFKDEMTTITDTLVAIRSARPRTTSVMIHNVEEEPRRATSVPTVQSQDKGKGKMVEPEPTPKNLKKAQIQMDEELSQRLFEEEQAQFEKEQRIARKKFFAAQRAEQIRNKPPTRAQLRNKMVTYLKHVGNYTHTQLKSKSFEEIQKLYEKEQKWINDFVPLDSEMIKDNGKEDGDSQKQAESRDDIAMDFESLATKYPIIDWKTHILTENMMYYQIIRAARSFKNYKIISGMLDNFDRQDVIDIYRLVKERYETTSPEGYDLLLWGDLKNLLEPSEEDEIWKNQ
ncbi:putative ribonuclease H-like domain-containing protein [Tanacetum coccineum]